MNDTEKAKGKPACCTTGGLFFLRSESGFFLNLGQCTLHFAAAEAPGAHVHPPGVPVYQDPNALHIGRPDAMALAVGMADIVTIQRALLANLTKLSHENPPPYGVYTSSLSTIARGKQKCK